MEASGSHSGAFRFVRTRESDGIMRLSQHDIRHAIECWMRLSPAEQAGMAKRAKSRIKMSPLYQSYLNDPLSVDSKLRRFYDRIAVSDIEPNDGEAFRLYRESDVNF